MGSKRDNALVLSIIIVNYKTRELLDRCLDSIFRAGFGEQIEVIVVDNGSGDGSVELVREKHPDVLLIANDENKGFSVANNQGIERSMGEMVLLLNPDTEVNREALSGMMDFMRRHPQVGVAGPQLLFEDGSLQTSWFHFPVPLSRFFERRGGYRKVAHALLGLRFKTDEETENGARRVDIIKGACMMVRREALRDVGLLEENSFLYCDDIDWCIRAARRSWEAYFLPAFKIIHVGWASTSQEPYLTIVHSRRSALYLYRKHYNRLFVAMWTVFIYQEIVYKW
ncbi:MAG: glycosyltransferase family 2 protein, partial [bacterium]